jgi:phosphate transport system substrate-binding protein
MAIGIITKAVRNPLFLFSTLASVVATVTLTVSSVQSQGTATVKIDGSSTVYPITEAIAEDFQKAKKGAIRVTVGISGTGGGFKKFCAGETDISNASRPIKDSEREQCKKAGISYIELPIAFDALTVVVNKNNTWASSMTVAELKKIWEPEAKGKIMKWDQVRSNWPNAPLKLYGPGADSGTFDYFTEAINGKSKASRSDYTPSEDDNVLVQGVARDKNALGYFGYAYYEANKSKIKAVAINNGKGAIMPSRQTVENGSYQPLARPIFIYVNAKAAQRADVKEFVEYYLTNGAKAVQAVKYIPLPAKAYQMAMGHFKNRRTGSVFVGRSDVGVTINELLNLEAKE